MMEMSKTAPEEELKAYFKLPFRYDPEGQYIFDAENNMIADIRAWGHLKDERLQDALGELIAKAVNDAWNSRPLLPEGRETAERLAERIFGEPRLTQEQCAQMIRENFVLPEGGGRRMQGCCMDCGRKYGDEFGFPDLIIPDDIWKRISPTHDEGGLLCPSCLCRRVQEAGIRCEAVFRSGPFCTREGSSLPSPGEGVGDRPKIVCLCGSTRFWREFQRASLRETMAGRIILSIGAASGTDDEHFGNLAREEYDKVKTMLDELHKRKIDLADEVLVLNVDGYIGSSTRSEIEYAEAHGKPVKYLEAARHLPKKG